MKNLISLRIFCWEIFLSSHFLEGKSQSASQRFLSPFYFSIGSFKTWINFRNLIPCSISRIISRLDFYLIFTIFTNKIIVLMWHDLTQLNSSQRCITVFYDWMYIWIQIDKDGGRLQQSRLEISIIFRLKRIWFHISDFFLWWNLHIYIFKYLSSFFETRIKSSFFE